MDEYTCEKYFTDSIIKMKSINKILYNKDKEVKGYFFKDETNIIHLINKSKLLDGKKAQKLIKNEGYFNFIVSNNEKDENSYEQYFNLISPYFIEFNEICDDQEITNFIFNDQSEEIKTIQTAIKDKNANWILTLDNFISRVKIKELWEKKNYQLLSKIFDLKVKIIDYINNSGFLYTQPLRNNSDEKISQKELILKRQKNANKTISSCKMQSKICDLYFKNKLFFYLEKKNQFYTRSI